MLFLAFSLVRVELKVFGRVERPELSHLITTHNWILLLHCMGRLYFGCTGIVPGAYFSGVRRYRTVPLLV